MTDVYDQFSAWKKEAIHHALGLGPAPTDSPDFIPNPTHGRNELMESLTDLPEDLLDAICGAASGKFTWLLLQRDYLIRGAVSFVPGLSLEDSTALWQVMLSEAMGDQGDELILQSGTVYPDLPSRKELRLMYDKLHRCYRGQFNHLSL